MPSMGLYRTKSCGQQKSLIRLGKCPHLSQAFLLFGYCLGFEILQCKSAVSCNTGTCKLLLKQTLILKIAGIFYFMILHKIYFIIYMNFTIFI